MTDDPGNELRDRFGATALPPAPVRLRERLATVVRSSAAEPPASGFGPLRLVIALAAIVAVASIGLLTGGGVDEPSPSPSALDPVAVATAEPPRFRIICEVAEPPALTCDEIVDMLLARVLLHLQSHGPIVEVEITRACGEPCPTEPGLVNAKVTFDSGDVVLVNLFADGSWNMMDEAAETDLPEEPTPSREPELACAEAEPPAPTCAAIRDAVLAALGPNHPQVERIEVIETCKGGQIPSCRRSDMVDVHVERLTIPMTVRDGPDGLVVAVRGKSTERSFGPIYPNAPDEFLPRGPWIWKATLSADRRTLSIEFFGWTDDPTMDPCTSEFEPRVEFSGPNLRVQVVPLPRQRDPAEPSPTPAPPGTIYACEVTGYRHLFHLALSEPFLNGDIFDLSTDEWVIHTEL